MPGLREQFGAKIQKEGFRGAYLVPAGVRLALPLQKLRLAFLGFPPLLSPLARKFCLRPGEQ